MPHENWATRYAHGYTGKILANKGIEDSGDKTTETMVDLAGTKMGEVLNKDAGSTRTGTVARTHRTLSGGRHRLER